MHTNLLATEALRAVEVPRDAVYAERNVAALRGARVHRSAEQRQDALERRLAERGAGPLCAADLLALFSDHGAVPGGDDDSLCRHGPYWTTAATLQLLPRERRLRVAFDAPCRAALVDFAL